MAQNVTLEFINGIDFNFKIYQILVPFTLLGMKTPSRIGVLIEGILKHISHLYKVPIGSLQATPYSHSFIKLYASSILMVKEEILTFNIIYIFLHQSKQVNILSYITF